MLTQEYIQGLVEGVIASKEARRRDRKSVV